MKQKSKKTFIHDALRITHYALRNKGVTLIEIAIVLIVIGILLGVGAGLVGPLTKRIKRSDSREVVKAAKEAVLGFAVKYKRLPNTTEFADNIKNTDAWGNTLYYYTHSDLYNPLEGNICYSPYTGFTVRDIIGPDKTDIAFIILSTAENGGNDTSLTGLPPFIIQEQSDTYDDIVTYGSIPELKNNVLACAGIEIVTTTLPNATEDSLYTTTLIGKGGSSPTWSVQGRTINDLGCSGNSYPLTDPNTADLCLYETTGIITGTVDVSPLPAPPGTLTTCTDTSTTFTVTLTQTGMNPVNKSFTITVYPQPLTITTTTLPDAKTRILYNITLGCSGGKLSNSNRTWSVISGTLPPGLSLSSDGVLSGTPTTQGTYNFTVNLADDPTTPCTTTSTAFTLNVIDLCFSTGMRILNDTNGNRSYRRGTDPCSRWDSNKYLNIQPGDTATYYFYRTTTCGTLRCTVNYSFFTPVDSDYDCSVTWTDDSPCTFDDL